MGDKTYFWSAWRRQADQGFITEAGVSIFWLAAVWEGDRPPRPFPVDLPLQLPDPYP